jgi:DNA-binding MarR family transcriptional regulator
MVSETRRVGKAIASLGNVIKRHKPLQVEGKFCKTTRMQRWIIGYLYEDGAKRSALQKEIEDAFSITRSTASTILGLMETRGLIRRESAPFDARQKVISLTQDAIDMCDQIAGHIERLEKKMIEGISDEELDVFFDVLQRIEQNLTNDSPDAACIGLAEERNL